MRDEYKLLEEHGLTVRGPTPWASPCFLVPKPRSEKLRTVIDFRQLNMQTRRDSHPIPHTRDVLQKITPFDCYNKLDLMSGFWQIAMEATSIQFTGVITMEMLYMWLRLPFGVRNGPPCFQRAISQAIHTHGLASMVAAFIDDLATGGKGHQHSAANCRKMFAMLEASNFKAGATKVFLGQEELAFLGYLLQDGALKPDPEKVVAIDRLLPPETRSELRAFLGLTGYYREFVHQYSHHAKPLTSLLKEDVAWEWTPACDASFQRLKSALTTSPILALPDPHRPYYLSTDYSHVAVGAVLEQLQEDGKRHVVSYASRTCSAAESRLGPTDGELLAIVYAVEKFHHYLAGTTFTIVTDHNALLYLNEAKTKNPKLARWAMRLAGYNFQLQHRAGRVHDNADGLSRSRATPAPDTPAPDCTALEELTFLDAPTHLAAALDAFENDTHLDGDPPAWHLPDAALPPTLGPR
jgi:hypothetical protein